MAMVISTQENVSQASAEASRLLRKVSPAPLVRPPPSSPRSALVSTPPTTMCV